MKNGGGVCDCCPEHTQEVVVLSVCFYWCFLFVCFCPSEEFALAYYTSDRPLHMQLWSALFIALNGSSILTLNRYQQVPYVLHYTSYCTPHNTMHDIVLALYINSSKIKCFCHVCL